MSDTLKTTAMAAIAKNAHVCERVLAAGPTDQYRAVGIALATSVAKRVGCSVNRATWALVDAAKATEASLEEVNEDY